MIYPEEGIRKGALLFLFQGGKYHSLVGKLYISGG